MDGWIGLSGCGKWKVDSGKWKVARFRISHMSQLNDNQCIALDANCGFDSYKVSVNYTEWQTVLKTLIYSIDCFFFTF